MRLDDFTNVESPSHAGKRDHCAQSMLYRRTMGLLVLATVCVCSSERATDPAKGPGGWLVIIWPYLPNINSDDSRQQFYWLTFFEDEDTRPLILVHSSNFKLAIPHSQV